MKQFLRMGMVAGLLGGCASSAEQAYINSQRDAECAKTAKPGTVEFQGCKEYLARQELANRLKAAGDAMTNSRPERIDCRTSPGAVNCVRY
jgi:hypothetical protein